MQQHHQHTPQSKMGLNRGKVLLDRTSSISSDLERCSLHTNAEEGNRTASQSRVTVEKLEKENIKLKMQYEELRCQYVQILEEAKEEKFEERRVNLLKAQVMQLERQVILLSEGLSSQLCRSQDVEKALDPLTQRLRSLLSSGADADVVIPRSELTQLVEACEDVKQKLHRKNKMSRAVNVSEMRLVRGDGAPLIPLPLLFIFVLPFSAQPGPPREGGQSQIKGSPERTLLNDLGGSSRGPSAAPAFFTSAWRQLASESTSAFVQHRTMGD